MITICFTGHRPNKLGGYNWDIPKNQDVILAITTTVTKIIKENEGEEFHFICGGALGVDQMAFYVCNKLKSSYKNIITEIAVPFKRQYILWNKQDFQKWRTQLYQADILTLVDRIEGYKVDGQKEDIYYIEKMQKRNEYMVNKSDIVIAVWDGTKGGTGKCVKYAKGMNKNIVIINPKELKHEI